MPAALARYQSWLALACLIASGVLAGLDLVAAAAVCGALATALGVPRSTESQVKRELVEAVAALAAAKASLPPSAEGGE